ncbi:MAG: DUF3775 domain-containing protein [Alphaproteobacteria bacterium]|nr:DUF3775 domain-containing protein [Alphaproteobacteria bacterium]
MTDKKMVINVTENGGPELTISPEKVCFIIVKAREFDEKEPPSEPNPASNPSDDKDVEVLEDYPDDSTLEELRGAIDELDDDEIIDLIALAWIGRGDFTKDDWKEAHDLADQRHRQHSSNYLVGIPTLGDYLEEGLAALGYSCEEYEIERL